MNYLTGVVSFLLFPTSLNGFIDNPLFLGELRHISRLRFWPMISVLKEKYLMEHDDAELLTSFLQPMMHYYPDSRATAAELVKHPWLEGVVVQGEEELAERTRVERMQRAEVERVKREMEEGNGERGKGKERVRDVKVEDVMGLGKAVKGLVGMGRI